MITGVGFTLTIADAEATLFAAEVAVTVTVSEEETPEGAV